VLEALRHYFAAPHDTATWGVAKQQLLNLFNHRQQHNGRIRRTDDTLLDYSVLPLPDGATMLSFMDVTATASVETALIDRNEALQKADRLKNAFLAHVSYELRSPLNAIIGFSEMLEGNIMGALQPKQREYIQYILRSSGQLRALIDDVLDLASLEAGYLTLYKTPVRVASLLDSVLKFFSDQAHARNIQLLLLCDDAAVDKVLLDSQRFRQVVSNLISNALHFTSGGGKVTVSAVRNTEWLEVSVSDTGAGIAPEDQLRIFEKFERGSNNKSNNGTGLGLALVKQFVELHDGRVELTSTAGVGTTVRCFFPVQPPVQ
jgi:signal transduction histidine kinase